LEVLIEPRTKISGLRNKLGNEIYGKCMLIAKKKRTSHNPKKHGGYDIHEERYDPQHLIKIALDTYVPNLSVRVNDKIVFSIDYHRTTSVLSLGNWIDYVNETWLEIMDQEMMAKMARREVEKELDN
jgi:hypothetical protein